MITTTTRCARLATSSPRGAQVSCGGARACEVRRILVHALVVCELCVSSSMKRSGNQSLVSMGDQKAVSNWIREACLKGFAPTKLHILINGKGAVQGP